MATEHVTNPYTVVVKSYGEFIHTEGITSGATMYAGTIVKNAAGTVTAVNGTLTTPVGAWGVLAEQEGMGLTMLNPYLVGDRCRVWTPRKGDQFRAFLPRDTGASADYAAGSTFMLGANGAFVPFVQSVTTDAELPNTILTSATLAISATNTKYKTTTTSLYRINGAQYTKTAEDNLELTAGTVNDGEDEGDFFGVWLVQINAAGAVTTKRPAADQVYATAAAAIAALPAPDANQIALGYILIETTDVKFDAGTTALTTVGTFVNATMVEPAFVINAFSPNPVLVELKTKLPEDNIKSEDLADRVVIFEVL